jgi:energy-coupling factor transport system ATP-binding protein
LSSAIHIANLAFHYPSPTLDDRPIQALRGIDIDIERGEFVSLMGPVGAGKTTLCLALNGAIPHMVSGQLTGHVVILGHDTRDISIGHLVPQVGLVLENAESQLFNATVADEIAFGLESLCLSPFEIERRIDRVLELVQLSGFRERSPRTLSGGEQKRLALASVIAMQPRILVLDEPTSGLDAHGRYEILGTIDRLRQESNAETTVVMASQDAEAVARFSDRVIVLVEGQVSLAGSPLDVFGRVSELTGWGIGIPQLARLSHRLGLPTALSPQDAARRWAGRSELGYALIRRPQVGSKDQPVTEPAVEIRDLHHDYPMSDRPALRGVSVDILRGEWLSVVGINGSGKSTLVRHLNGLLRPSSGRVKLMGRDTRQHQVGELARHIAYLPQNPDQAIFSGTVREEVAYGPRQLGLRGRALTACVEETLDTFGLAEIAHYPPAALDYGLRRQIALASITAMRTPIVGLDEPVTGLDRGLATKLLEVIARRHAAGTTIVSITHDLEQVVAFGQRVIAMRDGRIAAEGRPREILSNLKLVEQLGLEPLPVTLLADLIGCQPPLPVMVDDWRVRD